MTHELPDSTDEAGLERALAALQENDPAYAAALSDLAALKLNKGKVEEAQRMFERAMALRHDQPEAVPPTNDGALRSEPERAGGGADRNGPAASRGAAHLQSGEEPSCSEISAPPPDAAAANPAPCATPPPSDAIDASPARIGTLVSDAGGGGGGGDSAGASTTAVRAQQSPGTRTRGAAAGAGGMGGGVAMFARALGGRGRPPKGRRDSGSDAAGTDSTSAAAAAEAEATPTGAGAAASLAGPAPISRWSTDAVADAGGGAARCSKAAKSTAAAAAPPPPPPKQAVKAQQPQVPKASKGAKAGKAAAARSTAAAAAATSESLVPRNHSGGDAGTEGTASASAASRVASSAAAATAVPSGAVARGDGSGSSQPDHDVVQVPVRSGETAPGTGIRGTAAAGAPEVWDEEGEGEGEGESWEDLPDAAVVPVVVPVTAPAAPAAAAAAAAATAAAVASHQAAAAAAVAAMTAQHREGSPWRGSEGGKQHGSSNSNSGGGGGCSSTSSRPAAAAAATAATTVREYLLEPRAQSVGEVDPEAAEAEAALRATLGDCTHVVEVYGLSTEVRTSHLQDFVSAMASQEGRPLPVIKWVDDHHALLVCPDGATALYLLQEEQDLFRLRPFTEASAASQAVAASELLPPKERPKTTAAVAKRLLSHALGMSQLRDREAEKDLAVQRKAAREARREREQKLAAAWDDD